MHDKKIAGKRLKEKLLSLKDSETLNVVVILKSPPLRGGERDEIIAAINYDLKEKINTLLGFRTDAIRSYWLLPGFAAALDVKTIEKLLDSPEVLKIVSADEKVKIPVTRRKIYHPTRALFKDTLWQYKPLNASALWDKGLFGGGIVVGHLDTGVNPKHPELSGKVVGWARVLETGKVIPGKPEEAFDDNGHGSFTGGLIAGGSRENPLGIAPDARLISVKVLEKSGFGSLEQIIAGLQYIAAQKNVKIVNMSWGIEGYLSFLEQPMNNLLALGILPVAAIGNSGPEVSSSPGNIPGVLGVGALDFYPKNLNYRYLYPAVFSETEFVVPQSKMFGFTYYLKPDLVAPGVEVVSSGTKGYLLQSGSSAAAPIVSGLVAAILGKYKISPDALSSLLKMSANFASQPNFGYGWGVPDARKAVNYLAEASYVKIKSQSTAGKNVEGLVSVNFAGQNFLDVGYIHPLTKELTLPLPANTKVKLWVSQSQGKVKTWEITTPAPFTFTELLI